MLHVLDELRHSGAERMLATAAPAFRALGVDGEILSTGATPGAFAEGLARAGFGIHHVPFRRSPGHFWRAFRLMRRGRFDAVHIHVEQALPYYALVALASGAPVVLRTAHNTYEFSGWLRLRRAVQRRILSRLGVVHVAVGRAVQETERRRFGVEPVLVHNWYDEGRFRLPSDAERWAARARLSIDPAAFVAVTVGNCSPIKNHEVLLRALATVKGRPVVYLHVGDERGAPGERALAAELGLGDRVRFLGMVEDVTPALFAADVYVMPSLIEGFTVAALEAVATGLPAIVSDLSGLRELPSHFQGVRLVEPTRERIAAALEALAATPRAERFRHAERDARVVRDRFSIAAGTRAYAAIYRGETGGARAGERSGAEGSGA